MHEPDTILLSSLRLIITKIHAKYLSKRVYGFREKVERTYIQTLRNLYIITGIPSVRLLPLFSTPTRPLELKFGLKLCYDKAQ